MQDVGQMNFYLNYYKMKFLWESDNPPMESYFVKKTISKVGNATAGTR